MMKFFSKTQPVSSRPDSRVFMLSERAIHDRVWHCAFFEWEDLIAEWEGVDAHYPVHPFHLSRRLYTLANYATHSKRVSRVLTPHFDKCYLKKDYDLFFIICADIFELVAITSIKNWREKCRKAVCYLDECWSEEWLRGREHLLRPLEEFDHVFVGTNNSVETVSKLIGRPCSYLPFGVDAIKFAPFPVAPPRCIDVWNLGRRSAVTHQALLDLAERKHLHYYFDTVKNGNVLSWREHRYLVANLLKRSRYFIANYARADEAVITHGHQEIGARFFEGAAGGTVMLGKPPTAAVFDQYFDWRDAVIPIPFNAPDIGETIAELEAQPERVARIRRDNLVNSLLRHDWVHRWRQVLETVALEVTPQVQLREALLRDIAEKISESHLAVDLTPVRSR